MALQVNGKIVLAGVSSGDNTGGFAVVRYNSDGSVDRAFGNEGVTVNDFGGFFERAESVAIQSDGRIILVGVTDAKGTSDVTLARYFGDPAATDAMTDIQIPTIEIAQNFPNPFNSSTAIRLSLPTSEHVELVVFDLMGREIVRLLDKWLPIGTHEVIWRIGNIPSGLYLYRLTAGGVTASRTMTLVR